MQDLATTAHTFNPNPYWDKPLTLKHVTWVTPDLFDQNGYDLCHVEKLYADRNDETLRTIRNHRVALFQDWLVQAYKKQGAVLNHAYLFERKGYTGEAREQLEQWAAKEPVFYKMLNIKPKWGLDFSMDYYDSDGNTFEVLHWEYDGFDYDEINEIKQKMEPILTSIDWDDAAKQLLKKKDEWYTLDFFKQSDYKCRYFGITQERWKMVVWE